MHFRVTLRVLGILLMLFSSAMVAPLVLALIADDGTATTFLSSMGITFFSGFLMWAPFMHTRQELGTRDGFLITSLFWIALGLFGSLPFLMTESLHLTPTAAVYESISGLTTTGGTVIVGLDELPHSILLYRGILNWLGGIGVIVVAVAVLPMLGIGGMQLYKAEIPGPSKDSKLTPRITQTAKALASVYVTVTAICALAYWAAGMTIFDAVCHAMATLACGGFSTHDASMGYFDSEPMLLISSLFMFISSLNFGLHFMVWHRRSIKLYWADSETRFFTSVVLISIVTICVYLEITNTLGPEESFIHGVFQAISIVSTTGFTTQNFAVWPSFLPVLLLLSSFMGGCAGSTSGGMKAMRVMLICKQGVRELKQLVHPQAVIPLKIGRRRVEATIVSAVWSFFAVYTASFTFMMLALMATGLDFTTAFSAMAASINNMGPGLGEVAANYSGINDVAKGILCFAMVLGRLEVFTLLVLFTPMFWKI